MPKIISSLQLEVSKWRKRPASTCHQNLLAVFQIVNADIPIFARQVVFQLTQMLGRQIGNVADGPMLDFAALAEGLADEVGEINFAVTN